MARTRNLIALGYRRIVALLVTLGIVPAVLLSAIGVGLLVTGDTRVNLLMGILVLTFTGTLVTGVILVWVFLRREQNLSQLQADFVSKVSHELRTPLTSIRMFTETLELRRGDRVAEDRCIEALTRESERLQALIDRLLDWGRMEAGRRSYDMEEHAVIDIVQEAVSGFQPTQEKSDFSVAVDVPEDLPRFWCDRSALVDSLINLLSNAFKYGGSPLQIDVTARANAKHMLITVRDNGLGIPHAEHKRIFEKFYRMDDLLSRERDGSGLGLAIVKHVVKAHRGRVEVASEPGKGSAFTLVLPMKVPSHVKSTVAASANVGSAGDVGSAPRDAQ